MRTFAQNAKASQQATPAKSTIPARAHLGQSRKVNPSLRLQRRIGNQTSQRMLPANLEKRNAGSSDAVPAQIWHDFSRIPLFGPTNGARQTKMGQASAAIGPRLGSIIERSKPRGRLPAAARPALIGIPARTLENIRVHDDSAAHEATRGLSARAFTIGSDIYFGSGEYQPTTSMGLRVLAHEAAHAHQQANASLPPVHQLRVASPKGPEEAEANSFVDALGSKTIASAPSQIPAGSVARLMRLTFEIGNNPPETHHIRDSFREVKPGEIFAFGWYYPLIFTWKTGPVTVRGMPEPGSDWRVGMIQRLKDYWFNIWWGNDEIKCGKSYPLINMRDSRKDPPWFDSEKITGPFIADGQTDSAGAWMEDAPGYLELPYQHPKQKSAEPFGHFNFGCTFFTYITAFNSKSKDSKDSYQHLKRVYWQTMLAGTFDGINKKPGQQLTITDGGETVPRGVQDGPFISEADQPTVGGADAFAFLSPLTACWRKAKSEEKSPKP